MMAYQRSFVYHVEKLSFNLSATPAFAYIKSYLGRGALPIRLLYRYLDSPTGPYFRNEERPLSNLLNSVRKLAHFGPELFRDQILQSL